MKHIKVRKVLKADAIGALISFLMHAFVLSSFSSVIGIPAAVLYLLSVFPLLFLIWDVFVLIGHRINEPLGLRIISLANASYCFIAVIMLLMYNDQIRMWGWIYFIGEVFLVLCLSMYEWRVGKRG